MQIRACYPDFKKRLVCSRWTPVHDIMPALHADVQIKTLVATLEAPGDETQTDEGLKATRERLFALQDQLSALSAKKWKSAAQVHCPIPSYHAYTSLHVHTYAIDTYPSLHVL